MPQYENYRNLLKFRCLAFASCPYKQLEKKRDAKIPLLSRESNLESSTLYADLLITSLHAQREAISTS